MSLEWRVSFFIVAARLEGQFSTHHKARSKESAVLLVLNENDDRKSPPMPGIGSGVLLSEK